MLVEHKRERPEANMVVEEQATISDSGSDMLVDNQSRFETPQSQITPPSLVELQCVGIGVENRTALAVSAHFVIMPALGPDVARPGYPKTT